VIEREETGGVLLTRGAYDEAEAVMMLDAKKVGICESEIGHPLDLFFVKSDAPPPSKAGEAVADNVATPTPRVAQPAAPFPLAETPTPRGDGPNPWSKTAPVVTPTRRISRVWIAVAVFLIAAVAGVVAALVKSR
jgi:hypothetical protein